MSTYGIQNLVEHLGKKKEKSLAITHYKLKCQDGWGLFLGRLEHLSLQRQGHLMTDKGVNVPKSSLGNTESIGVTYWSVCDSESYITTKLPRFCGDSETLCY